LCSLQYMGVFSFGKLNEAYLLQFSFLQRAGIWFILKTHFLIFQFYFEI